MHELRNGFTREDVISMLHDLMYDMDREVMKLSETIRNKWNIAFSSEGSIIWTE
ncbi:hypothetical protein [Paenibacillus agricola]|uniref:hypothetical protein n=1 Tax=Paenibacillus agricola TaxID=2716264 RepID=UPI001A9D11C8|nr:hypothetical protein [Paenibacillus agricola]